MNNKWVIDIDGTITSNITVFRWLTYHLKKSGQFIIILTGRNPSRLLETIEFLNKNNIEYNQIITMKDEDPRGFKNISLWKLNKIKEINPMIWIDDNIKEYRELFPSFMDNISFIGIDI